MSRPSRSTSIELVLGLMFAAVSLSWLITPMRHPGAPAWKTASVVVELVVGIGLIVYAGVRHRRERAS
jgi:hypothetical protein